MWWVSHQGCDPRRQQGAAVLLPAASECRLMCNSQSYIMLMHAALTASAQVGCPAVQPLEVYEREVADAR